MTVSAEAQPATSGRPPVWPLTPPQQALWFLENFNPGSSCYVIGIGLALHGPLDPRALWAALADTIARHEALRSRFLTLAGRPYQVFLPATDLPDTVDDLSGEPDPERAARAYLEEMSSAPFDLGGEPPLRLRLTRLGPDRHALLLAVHHIVFDGWSTQVLLTDLAACYAARLAGSAPALAPLDTGVGEYAAGLAAGAPPADLDYWRTTLRGAPVLELPTDRPRPPSRTFAGAARAHHVDATTTAALRALARDLDTSLFTVLGTAFTTLLSRLSGSDDIVVGVPLAGRTTAATQGLVGFFANTLPLRVDLAGSRTFRESVDRLRGPVHELLTRQHVPFAELVEALAPARHANRNPFYDVCFQYLPAGDGTTAFRDLQVGFLDCDRRAAQFDLSCDVHELGDQLVVQFEYSTELFHESTIHTYLDQYAALLREAVSSQPVATVDTSAPVGAFVSGGLAGIVARQAERRPTAPAVRCASRALTFAELDDAAARFAGRLRELGVTAGDRVGVLLEPSVDLAVAMLGVLRIGAVYVPGDVRTPIARTEDTFRQAGCVHIVREMSLGSAVGLSEVDSEAPAYIIFTSGSTGRPKGVVVGQGAAVSLASAATDVYRLDPADVVLQLASPSVDVSIEEFFASWHAGAEVFVNGPVIGDVAGLAAEHGLTVLNLPAALWHEWTRQVTAGESTVPERVRLVIAGSDRVDPHRVRQWRSGPGAGVRLLNAYGVTEAAVSSAWYDTEELDSDAAHTTGVPIGRRFPHAALYVLDEDGAPVPDGVPGELWIGGPGVALGYLDDPDATADRFRPDPFLGDRMYRTGDVVRRLPSGALDFRGRRDTQVKIRGTRIELAEVERALSEVPGIAQSCADVRPDENGVPRLIGYLRLDPNADAGLSADRVEEWRRIHDADVFNEVGDDQQADLNTSGWISSYTGELIGDDAMAEWRDEFVARLLAEPPGRVLEIGCGTGMILLPVAPLAEYYVGTDISPRALDYVRSQLPATDRVRLVEGAAHELDSLGDDSFDLVVLNSVVQYFPTDDYLAQVLETAWRLLRPGGRIVVGDVRDLTLLGALHESIARHRNPGQDDPNAVDEAVETENELCLAPGWFTELASRLGGQAVCQAKTGRAVTEMNGFRYDVILRRSSATPLPVQAVDPAHLFDTPGPVRASVPDSRVGPHGVHPAELMAQAHGVSISIRQAGGGLLDVLVGTESAEPLPVGSGPLANRPLATAARRETIAAVRARLGEHLPKAMIPSRLVFVAEFPVLASGKVDRSKLPDPPRMVTTGTGAAPATELERSIAACWEQVLGVPNLTTADNFFEIGGDSISWLRIMSRCARIGIILTARDIFDHQTIAALAESVSRRQPVAAAPAARVTEAGLTPIQRWFVNALADGLDWQHQVQWYDLPDGCSLTVLRQALHDVARQHDALAATEFTPDWSQRLVDLPAELPVTEVILPSYGPRRDELVAAADHAAQTGVSVSDGPLFRFVVFRTPSGEPDFAEWCVHHIAVDAVSWQFLTEDFTTALTARRQGATPEFPPRTASVLDWSEWSEQAAAEITADEVAYWHAAAEAPALALPVRHPAAAATYGRAHHRSRNLVVPQGKVSGELVTATVLAAVRQVLGGDGSVWLEYHGRPLDGAGPDVTRTVGWFTALFPFVLDPDIRARLAEVPGGGIGYGRLRHLTDTPVDTDANVVVNCLTATDTPVDALPCPRPAPEVAGGCVDPAATMPFALEVNVVHDPAGSVRLDLAVSARHLDAAEADDLADRLGAALAEAFARRPEAFALLADDVRSALLARLPEIEAAYPLLPTQQLMLNRHLLGQTSDANYNESVLTLDGDLDSTVFRAAWQALAERHEVLRTSVEWLGLPAPVQVVHRSAPDPVRTVDWSALSEVRVQRRLAQLLDDERATPPALSGTPPFRLILVRTGPTEHRLLWLDHHILLDGWSSAILLRELLDAYTRLAAGEPAFAGRAVPYRAYAAWLAGRTNRPSDYWREALAGFTAPTDLPFDAAPALATAGSQDYADLDMTLPADLTAAVDRTARQRRTTAGNVIAAAWAAFLHRYTGNATVSFGLALSGRPAELGDVTGMVGLYLTTLPQVVHVEPAGSVGALVDEVTRSGWRLAEVSPVSWLWDVYRWAGIPASRILFHSVLVLQNFGGATGADGESRQALRARTEHSRLVTGAPLTVAIDPAGGALRLVWDSRAFSRPTAQRIVETLVDLLGRVTGDVPVAALPAPRFVRQQVATRQADDRIYLPPKGPVEERVAEVWREVLGVARVGRDLNLFDAGANSMTVMHLHVVLCETFGVPVALPAFFQYPTVQGMARLFEAAPATGTVDPRLQARTQRRRAALSGFGPARRATPKAGDR